MLTFVVLIAVAVVSMVMLARLLGRVERDATPPVPVAETPVPEQTEFGEPEWGVVMREQCLPLNCPNLRGNPKRPGKEPGCQVCAAMFLERFGERLLKSQREGRNR
jgi:hypothetical protein